MNDGLDGLTKESLVLIARHEQGENGLRAKRIDELAATVEELLEALSYYSRYRTVAVVAEIQNDLGDVARKALFKTRHQNLECIIAKAKAGIWKEYRDIEKEHKNLQGFYENQGSSWYPTGPCTCKVCVFLRHHDESQAAKMQAGGKG